MLPVHKGYNYNNEAIIKMTVQVQLGPPADDDLICSTLISI